MMVRKADSSIISFVNGPFKSKSIDRLEKERQSSKNNAIYYLKQIKEWEVSKNPAQVIASNVTDLEKAIRKAEDRANSYAKKIKEIEDLDPSGFEEEIRKNPMLEDLEVDEKGRLNFYTKMLKDGSHNIGRFRICIYPDQSSGLYFRVVNLDYRYENLCHWAISNTVCCLGEWEIDFKNTLSKGDLPTFFSVVVHYITLSPERNTYCKKEDWYGGRTKLSKEVSDRLRSFDMSRIGDIYDSAEEEGEDVDEVILSTTAF